MNNGYLALRLIVLEELNTAGRLRDDGIVLRLAGLEQFSNARQTAGYVPGLGNSAVNKSQHGATMPCLPILDQQALSVGQLATPTFSSNRSYPQQTCQQHPLRTPSAP